AFGLGHELDKVEATAVAITPGWLRSEMMLDDFDTTEDDWMRDSLDETRTEPPRDFAISETPHLLGLSVVALAADPDRHSFNSTTQDTHGLAVHYGFNDLDGSRPDSWNFIPALEHDPAADPDRHSFNSTTQDTHGLAVHYGFNDLDGSRPDSWNFITALENDPAADPREFR